MTYSSQKIKNHLCPGTTENIPTIGVLLAEAKKRLQNSNSDFLGLELILSHALGITRQQLITQSQKMTTPEQQASFWALFERFYAGEPVAYLIKRKEFYGLDFYVDKRVLVPRPETEMLVDEVINYTEKRANDRAERRQPVPVQVLDVGTGSGCIAVAIAKNLPQAHVTAVDISAEALQVAAQNIKKHGLEERINLLQSDLIAAVEDPFDVIVANLPYIGEKKFNFISREAKEYEPSVALFGGEDGLQLYRNLFTQLQQKKWQPKVLLGEFGFLQGEEMRKLLAQFFREENWTIRHDLASIERMFMVAWGGISF